MHIPGATRPNSVWTYDFVHDRLANGGQLKLLCVLDEYMRECLAIEEGKSLRNPDVILILSRLMRIYGKPAVIRSDNGGGIYRNCRDEMAARPECRASLYHTW